MSRRHNTDDIDRAVKEIISIRQPSTGEDLVDIVTKEMSLSREEAIDSMLRLEARNEIQFRPVEDQPPTGLVEYLSSPRSLWYRGVNALSLTAVLSTFITPSLGQLIIIRYVAGSIFLMFLPGFCITKIIYLGEEIGNLKLVAMSLGISVSVVSLIGMALNYTPWGISTTALTFTVFLLVLALSSICATRELENLNT